MSAPASSPPLDPVPDPPAFPIRFHRQPHGEPGSVVHQLDLATEAALAAVPIGEPATRLAARRALESSIGRQLSDLGLADLARRYRARRRRRDTALTGPAPD